MGRTQNLAANRPGFNIQDEFWLALDEFCGEKHFWWRRKAASFQTVAGQQEYDLGNQASPIAPDLEEVEEAFVVNAQPLPYPYIVNPEFSPRNFVASLYGNGAVQGILTANGYFIDPNNFQNFVLAAPADSVYTIALTYWAIPMLSAGTSQDTIPLVPPFLHWGLVYMLEKRIYEYLVSQDDPRAQMATLRYNEFVMKAARSKQFSSQEAKHSQMQRPSVSASGGRGYYGSINGAE